jgi:hypothetical protein
MSLAIKNNSSGDSIFSLRSQRIVAKMRPFALPCATKMRPFALPCVTKT